MPPGREQGVADVVAARLRDYRLDVRNADETPWKTQRRRARSKVSTRKVRSSSLNDHLDTYHSRRPFALAENRGDPYRLTRDGDLFMGGERRTSRGNLACTLLAVEAHQRANVRLKGTIKCVYTVDEEKNGPDGSIFLLDEWGLRGDYEITCEPTGWTKPRRHVGHGHRRCQFGPFPHGDRDQGDKNTHLAA